MDDFTFNPAGNKGRLVKSAIIATVFALVAAFVYALITGFTGFKVYYLAIAIGLFIGWGVKTFGKGITMGHAIIAMVATVVAIIIGEALALIIYSFGFEYIFNIDYLKFAFENLITFMNDTPIAYIFYVASVALSYVAVINENY